jgi:hypothetical protein
MWRGAPPRAGGKSPNRIRFAALRQICILGHGARVSTLFSIGLLALCVGRHGRLADAIGSEEDRFGAFRLACRRGPWQFRVHRDMHQ